MKRGELLAAGSLALSVAALGALLGIHRWMPDPGILTVLSPTLESAVAVGAIVLAAKLNDRRPAWVHWPLALVLAALVLFGIGEGFYQAIFRKGFVPWTDLGFIPPLLNMVFQTGAFSRPALTLLPVFLLAIAVSAVVYGLIKWVDSGIRRVSTLTSLVILLVFVSIAIPLAARGMRTPLVVSAARQLVRPTADIEQNAVAAAAVPPATPAGVEEYHFAGLQDRDIHLFIVESYGHTLFTNESHRPLIEPVYQELGVELDEAGYHAYSSFLESPAFGGRSWLADATILTGAVVDSQHKYDEIVKVALRNLSHILGEAGYHRVLAAPGTYEADDSWRAFYEFDQYLFRYDFGYVGPFVSFGAMPDQFLIYRTHQLVADINRPVFTNYVLVSSHVPFEQLPQYVEDWSALGDGSIFNEIPLRYFDNNWLSGGEYPQGYVASIEYTLTAVTRFITEVIDEDALFIIIGDHQPRIPISEQDATFSVPVHVISKSREAVAGFSEYGFTPGIVPRSAPPHRGMEELLGMFLTVAHGQVNSGRLPE